MRQERLKSLTDSNEFFIFATLEFTSGFYRRGGSRSPRFDADIIA